MKVLFVAAEVAPLVKTGGLGDVAGSLPLALKKEGIETAVILPLYGDIPSPYRSAVSPVQELTVPLAWRKQYCGLKAMDYKGIPFYFLDNEYYFNRTGIYGHYDDAERFAFFSRAVLEAVPFLHFKPDLLHCHDWHTGLVSVFLQAFYREKEPYKRLKTVLTIHNLQYQGVFDQFVLGDILGLGEDEYSSGLVSRGAVNYLKGGLVFADFLTTVSPGYAEEIQGPELGAGLEDVLKNRASRLLGIINGIDWEEYNPASDPALYQNYRQSLMKKGINKKKLQQELGLPVRKNTPLLAVVSRLVEQKGFDLLFEIEEQLLSQDLQLVVLGTGEKSWEKRFRELGRRHEGKSRVIISFDEALARRIYAGSDFFLMPSLFEPCGLSQMIAMRYGCIPVVRKTGGLKDTVRPYNALEGTGNGFCFTNYDAGEFLAAILEGLATYQEKDRWAKVVKNALKSDFSWKQPAREYAALYSRVLQKE